MSDRTKRWVLIQRYPDNPELFLCLLDSPLCFFFRGNSASAALIG